MSIAQLQIEDRFGNDLFETQPNDGINSGLVTLAGGDEFFIRLRSKTDGPAEYVVDLQASAPTGPVIGTGNKFDDSPQVGTSGDDDGPGNSPLVGSFDSHRFGASAQLATYQVNNIGDERLRPATRHETTDLVFAEFARM